VFWNWLMVVLATLLSEAFNTHRMSQLCAWHVQNAVELLMTAAPQSNSRSPLSHSPTFLDAIEPTDVKE